MSEGVIGRFGALDATDGGDTHRYSGSLEWQRATRNATTKVTAYGIGYDLNLFSNFTFFLDDPDHGDQFHQADRRFVSGAKVSHTRLNRWGARAVRTTFGAKVRNDSIATVGLYHTEARQRLETVREDSVRQTSGAVYLQKRSSGRPGCAHWPAFAATRTVFTSTPETR